VFVAAAQIHDRRPRHKESRSAGSGIVSHDGSESSTAQLPIHPPATTRTTRRYHHDGPVDHLVELVDEVLGNLLECVAMSVG
jgi:hypothetical protein